LRAQVLAPEQGGPKPTVGVNAPKEEGGWCRQPDEGPSVKGEKLRRVRKREEPGLESAKIKN